MILAVGFEQARVGGALKGRPVRSNRKEGACHTTLKTMQVSLWIAIAQGEGIAAAQLMRQLFVALTVGRIECLEFVKRNRLRRAVAIGRTVQVHSVQVAFLVQNWNKDAGEISRRLFSYLWKLALMRITVLHQGHEQAA